MSPEKHKKSRLSWLDELRGAAALAVVIFHYLTNYDKHYGHSFDVPQIFSYGQLGVPLFFIISGFVIFMTTSRSKGIIDFAISRITRLYPVFWVAVTITFIWTSLLGPNDRVVGTTDYIINLTMLHEYLSFAHVDRVYWTLSIELAFYFWMGAILLSKQLRNINYYLFFLVTLSLFQNHIADLLRMAFILKYIAFFASGICFYQIHTKTDTFLSYTILSISLLAVFLYNSVDNAIIISLIYLYFYWLCLRGKKVNPILGYLGGISYSLYLIHQNIGYSLIQTAYQHDIPPYISITGALVVSLLSAHILRLYIEIPGQRLFRDKLKKQRDFFAKKLFNT